MGERVAALDANFFRMDTATTQQVIACYSPLDAVPDFEVVRESIEREVASFPRLRQRIDETQGLRWVDDPTFDLTRHLRFELVPEAKNFAEMLKSVEAHFSSQMDLSHPPWEYIVFSNCPAGEPDALVGVLYRLHHCLADGLGALEFFHRVCDLQRDSRREEQPKRSHRHSGQTGVGPTAGKWNFFRSLRRLYQEAREPVPKSALNGPNSAVRKFALAEFSLAEMKVLRRRYRSSMNDLLLALVTGAARKYQLATKVPPIDVKALIPFNLRRKGELTTLGNRLTGVGIPLPASIADPVGRLRAIQAVFNRVKSDGSFGAYRIMGIVNSHLPRKLQVRFGEAAARRLNFICTNMPGPEKPLYFGGARILGEFGFAALLREQGCAFAFMTYAGSACISVVTDPAIVPNPWELIGYVKDTFEELSSGLDASEDA